MSTSPEYLAYGWTVAFCDMWSATPVFHSSALHTADMDADGVMWTETRTPCGLAVHAFTLAPDGTYRRKDTGSTLIPSRHAARIGRPCRKCFPQEDRP